MNLPSEPGTPNPPESWRDPPGLLSREEAVLRCEEERRKRKRIVFTNGCFDLLHPGHVLYLSAARAMGDLLIVGLNSDAGVRALKGEGRPYLSERARALLLLSLRVVDLVSVFDEPTPYLLISLLRPDILVKGGDYTPEEVVGRDVVESYGGTVRIVPFQPGFSSTGLIRRIREG